MSTKKLLIISFSSIFITVIVAVIAVLAIRFISASVQANRARDEVYQLGIEAISVIDDFLDMEIIFDEASERIIEIHGNIREYIGNIGFVGNEFEIIVQILAIFPQFICSSPVRGSRVDRQEVFERRNNLAGYLNQPLRDN